MDYNSDGMVTDTAAAEGTLPIRQLGSTLFVFTGEVSDYKP